LVPPTLTEPSRPGCAAAGGSDVRASAKDFTMSSSLPTYSAVYAFGDSLSDAGNLSISTVGTTPVSPPYYKQQYGILSGNVFSNGPTWVQNLSIALGLGTLAPSLAGGTDFAFGGAQTGSTPQNSNLPAYAAVSLPAQLSEFHTREPNPSANALYTLSVGANDLDTILATTLTAQQQTTDVNAAVANEIAFVNHLIGDGAKNLLVLDVPDLGKIPEITQGLDNGSDTASAGYDAQASQLTSEYNTALNSQLAAITGANVHVVNAYVAGRCDRGSGGLRADQCHNSGLGWQFHQCQQRHASGDQHRRAGPIFVLGYLSPDRDRPSGNRRLSRDGAKRHVSPHRRGYDDGPDEHADRTTLPPDRSAASSSNTSISRATA
jgi:hypothetical protein